jgi:ketosteroid isomerase-like protein
VRAGDAERLAALVTDDVVVVHGNGRCVRGRDELKADFLRGFEAFSIEQNVSSAEIIIRPRWAFEICEVESLLTPRRGGQPMHIHSTTVVALNQQPDGSWKVGRVLGLVHSPPPDLEVGC